ncbi:MAG: ACT domain-containing protein [Candidatus Bathyarchaeia archaeon]
MKFSLTLALPDKPGQLLRALEPIAKNGGNIISIIHERDKPVEGYVPVSLVVDFLSHQSFRKTIEELRSFGISIIKSEEVVERHRLTFILIGSMDIKRVIESRLDGVDIISVEVVMSKSGGVSIRLEIEAPADVTEKVVEKLKRIVSEQSALLIPSIGV